MNCLSSAENSLRISFSSSRSEIRRLSNRSCNCRLPSWYMTLSAMAVRPPPIHPGARGRHREAYHFGTTGWMRRLDPSEVWSVRRAQPVSDAGLGQHELWTFRIGLDLLPELADIDA